MWCHTILTLVVGRQPRGAVWTLCGACQLVEHQLAYWGAQRQLEGSAGQVLQLQGDRAPEAWVDEPGRGVDDQTLPGPRRLAVHLGYQVGGDVHLLDRSRQHEIVGLHHEALLVDDV